MKDAATSYAGKIAETLRLLDTIRIAAEDHFDLSPAEVTWANVGDITRVNDTLMEIITMCNL